MTWTALFVLCRLLSSALVDGLHFDPRWRLIDLWNSLYLVGSVCLQMGPETLNPPAQPEWYEAALVLGISPRTADRVWSFARAWLHRELADTEADQEK